jgi:hypothetical protein
MTSPGISNLRATGFRLTALIMLFEILSGCFINSSKSNDLMNARFYTDLDMFNLEGINELTYSELKFPYIRMDSINSQKKQITFLFDNNTIFEKVYIKKSSTLWLSEQTVEYKGEE